MKNTVTDLIDTTFITQTNLYIHRLALEYTCIYKHISVVGGCVDYRIQSYSMSMYHCAVHYIPSKVKAEHWTVVVPMIHEYDNIESTNKLGNSIIPTTKTINSSFEFPRSQVPAVRMRINKLIARRLYLLEIRKVHSAIQHDRMPTCTCLVKITNLFAPSHARLYVNR